MNIIKQIIKDYKKKKEDDEKAEKKMQHRITMDRYKKEYNNRFVLLSNGLKGKVCGVSISYNYIYSFGYTCLIRRLYIMVDKEIYEIKTDEVIGVEFKK